MAAAALVAAGCGLACARRPAPGEPLRGLSRAERARFEAGKAVFSREFEPETGLGPLFNSTSCGECHEDPVPGGVGDEIERHATVVRKNGTCDDLAAVGGPVLQNRVTPALKAALGIDEEPVPAGATLARRTTPIVMGLGLLDAVTDEEILGYADPDDRNHDGISGRPNRGPDGRIGRFGRKALIPTLREFNAGAFHEEQGITSPTLPVENTVGGKPLPAGVDPVPDPEIDAATVDAVDDFVRFLAPPSPAKRSVTIRRGGELFRAIGCAACHVPALRTGRSPVLALSHRRVFAYTDLLLHDMGPDLADICLGLATPSEFRTAPLMGLRLRSTFLHDGRATSIEEAVRLHGGEGAASAGRFGGLDAKEREKVLEFLKNL